VKLHFTSEIDEALEYLPQVQYAVGLSEVGSRSETLAPKEKNALCRFQSRAMDGKMVDIAYWLLVED
jgi:hypothetical protein